MKKFYYEKNQFKGKVGVFEISKNRINHILNFYKVEKKKSKKFFNFRKSPGSMINFKF